MKIYKKISMTPLNQTSGYLIVYVFDFDFGKKQKNKIVNASKINSSSNAYHCDTDSRMLVHIFTDRRRLHESIKQKKPDILLFDLYSASESVHCSLKCIPDSLEKNTKIDPDNSCHLNEELHKKNGVELITKETKKIPCEEDTRSYETEVALCKMQFYKQQARRKLKSRSHPTGIDEIHSLVNHSDVSIDFPIAVFSRYGRQLLSTEDILKIQKLGAYFVWKSKSKSTDKYSKNLTNREIASIYSVIDAYDENIARFSKSLLKEKNKINQIEKELRLNWMSRSVEYWFAIAVLFAAIVYGRPLFGEEINFLSNLASDFFSYKWLSPLMLITSIFYAKKIYTGSHRISLLLEAHKTTSSIINDLIAARKN
jgi:hypothetical protein